MKPDWDKLMDAFADSETQLIADVDCTAEGKDLCSTHGIRGYVSDSWTWNRERKLERIGIFENSV